MSRITKTVTTESTHSIVSFIGNITKDTKHATYPILLSGGVDVTVQLKPSVKENHTCIIAKVGDIIVLKQTVLFDGDRPVFEQAAPTFETLLPKVVESLYDNSLIGNENYSHLTVKLKEHDTNTLESSSSITLPGNYAVVVSRENVVIHTVSGEMVELKSFTVKGFTLGLAMSVIKSIAAHMVDHDFAPFTL